MGEAKGIKKDAEERGEREGGEGRGGGGEGRGGGG